MLVLVGFLFGTSERPESSLNKKSSSDLAQGGPIWLPCSNYHMFREVHPVNLDDFWFSVGYLLESRLVTLGHILYMLELKMAS